MQLKRREPARVVHKELMMSSVVFHFSGAQRPEDEQDTTSKRAQDSMNKSRSSLGWDISESSMLPMKSFSSAA